MKLRRCPERAKMGLSGGFSTGSTRRSRAAIWRVAVVPAVGTRRQPQLHEIHVARRRWTVRYFFAVLCCGVPGALSAGFGDITGCKAGIGAPFSTVFGSFWIF